MALIKCTECGQIFEDTLNACPNCGNPDKVNALNDIPKKGRDIYKIIGVIMLVISMFYALDYIFGHILFASGGMSKSPDLSDLITMQYALLFAIYGLIFIYLYKH